MQRTYRVEIAGRFDRLDPELKATLLTEATAHSYEVSGFTPDGTFTYAEALTRFTLRYLLVVDAGSAVEADELAAVEAQVRAEGYLTGRGIPVKTMTTSLTCLEDVKSRTR